MSKSWQELNLWSIVPTRASLRYVSNFPEYSFKVETFLLSICSLPESNDSICAVGEINAKAHALLPHPVPKSTISAFSGRSFSRSCHRAISPFNVYEGIWSTLWITSSNFMLPALLYDFLNEGRVFERHDVVERN